MSLFSRLLSLGTLLLLIAAVSGCDRILGPSNTVVVTYSVGDTHNFNVQLSSGELCSAAARDVRAGKVVTISEKAIVIADVANPRDGYTDEEYRQIADTFDRDIYPTIAHHFGAPHDIDRNGRVIIFFTRAVNELTPAGSPDFVAGAFATRDLFPVNSNSRLGACPGSNQAELLYLAVPDPTGEVNGNRRHKTIELRRAAAAIAHELQHLINASRRLYDGSRPAADWAEDLWLNEGLSHIAEELMAYHTSPLTARSNITLQRLLSSDEAQTAFAVYASGNFQLLALYLQNPEGIALFDGPALAGRGAAWQFLRYAADRRGGSEAAFWRGLIEPGSTGLANLRGSLGTEPMDWIHDWLVSVYVDDHVPGAHPRFTQPSWNFRNLLSVLRTPEGESYGRYPLRTRTLTDGVQTSLALAAGSAAYLRFGVAAGTSAEIRTSSAGASCREAGPARTLAVGEVVILTGTQADVVCLEGTVVGAEFTLVPFNAAPSAALALSLRGSGIGSAAAVSTAPGEPVTAQAAAPLGARGDAVHEHRGWEVRFREQEQRELSRLVSGTATAGAQPSNSVSTSSEGVLRIAVVRTR